MVCGCPGLGFTTHTFTVCGCPGLGSTAHTLTVCGCPGLLLAGSTTYTFTVCGFPWAISNNVPRPTLWGCVGCTGLLVAGIRDPHLTVCGLSRATASRNPHVTTHSGVGLSTVDASRDRTLGQTLLILNSWEVSFMAGPKQLNPFRPEFTIVIFIHYKPRIAVAILDEDDLMWVRN